MIAKLLLRYFLRPPCESFIYKLLKSYEKLTNFRDLPRRKKNKKKKQAFQGLTALRDIPLAFAALIMYIIITASWINLVLIIVRIIKAGTSI